MWQFKSKEILGITTVFLSAIFFYLATVSIRWAALEVHVSINFFVFSRFFLGFLFACMLFLVKARLPKPKRYDLLLGRAITNVIAVFCFFQAIQTTTVAEANILNMTYPLFIAVFSWFLFREQRDLGIYVTVVIACCGIWMLLFSSTVKWNPGHLWGLASGITAAWAIIFLNMARQYNDTDTILLIVFAIGVVILYGLFYEQIYLPDKKEALYLLLSGGFGVTGQYFLTVGLRYISALEGSIVSSSRILMAAVLGPYLVADPPLGVLGGIGAILIFLANVYIAWKK